MKHAFIDANGILTAWGFMASEGDNTRIEVEDDFALESGKWRRVDDQWVPHEPARTVPTAVTMRQARLALLGANKLSAVDPAISALPSPQKEAASIEWNYSSIVERNSDIVAMLGPILGLDEAALDALFIEASSL